MTRALVLGAGRVGHAIACDLAGDSNWQVTSADLTPENLARVAERAPVATVEADLSDPQVITQLSAEADIVVGAMPSFLGFKALEAVLQAGKNFVDISFFEEDPFVLEPLAQANGCTAVVDCGVAPGCDNLILGRMLEELDRIDRFVCYVGGLPRERHLPWEYKAPFAPNDVLNEYIRPARWVRGGKVLTDPALVDVEAVDIPGIGTLEAFLTDGLRSLLTTVNVPDMQEKTLRYPGHETKISLLKASGFFDDTPIQFPGGMVSPLEMTSKLLLPLWELEAGEPEFTALKVVIDGESGGQPERHTFDMLDYRDPETGFSSMARTTGFTCTAVARAVAKGTFATPGLFAPEHVGRNEACYRAVFGDLAERGIEVQHSVESLSG